MGKFVHLHVHTQYSILDGAASIPKLFEAAEADGQTALAITDHGNMFGVKEFFKYAKKHPAVKPIIGSEVYVARSGDRFTRNNKEEQSSYHLILLAKNMQGYRNLVKLSSLSYIEGFYFKPRIDHELLEKYHEGLICSSACLAGEVARNIYHQNFEEAEKRIQFYKNLFGDDYYLEVMRHETDVPGADNTVFAKQQMVNEKIFEYAQKYGIKVIATNDVHFVKKEDGPAHDRLICLTTNENYDEPLRLRYTQQEYLKTQEEMSQIFSDHPEVITNTLEVADKIESYSIDSDPILPHFDIPAQYTDSDDYLRALAYKGAKERYGEELSEETTGRIDFELATIKKMGFPDYFLIVQDFIAAARKMGVWVGPGRGSAAGSVVAYCLGITNIDPLKYDLLFERFLNPDRINMPDIDIDFDDEGRAEVYRYVEDKYGKDHISHVATFGTMKAKQAIKDVARIHQVPLAESDRLSKMIPERSWEVVEKNEKGESYAKTVDPTIQNCLKYVPEFSQAYKDGEEIVKETINYASELEGSIRQTGVHACATIIGREDLTNFIPLCTVKDKDAPKGSDDTMLVSQFEGSFIEDVGMLKMDFLGLSTLSIMKECVNNIKQTHGIDIDIDRIPIDDKETFELFSRGDTIAVFQFESAGMQKWLKELKPSRFEDLIAMNALYRPGPMDFIPSFVARKQGREKITYDLPEMEDILKDTYGVTVYQEQVMLLSRKLANFTPGEADTLRKAMGKKKLDVLMGLHDKYMDGGKANGHSEDILTKIWDQWVKFASYAFNKSHATCYAWIGYQTAYLKAHYPAEFLAANLSRNLDDIKEIIKLMDDCKHLGISVLGPDVNESNTEFTVNKKGNIRFGMAGIKGVGPSVVNSIIAVREKDGPFKDIYDFVERVPLMSINRKVMESFAAAGAFDGFSDITRAQFFVADVKGESFIDALLRYANKYHNDSLNQAASLFGNAEEMKPIRPEFPVVSSFDQMELLRREKEVVGMYLSSHPLDKFSFEVDNLADTRVDELSGIEMSLSSIANDKKARKTFIVAAYISAVEHGVTRNNKPMAKVTIEDYSGSYTYARFGKDYEDFLQYDQVNTPVLMLFTIEKRFGKDEATARYDLKLKKMMLLANAGEQLLKEFIVVVPLEKINENFIKSLEKQCKKNKGNLRLYFRIVDSEDNMQVLLFSKSYHITPSPEFLSYLRENGLSYGVSKDSFGSQANK
ncbi:MAG: DNA polymerase III subunit alpha [Bacteroidales bacterium]|nr:DNA polymerase III subunit alpha [Bacteroidales bacterium]